MIKYIFLDIDNTLLNFDEYVRQTMRDGFQHFGLKAYEPWMYDEFCRVNGKLWEMIERAEITFEELQLMRWNMVFEKIGFDFDGPTFENYFRVALHDSAIPMDGAYDLLEALYKIKTGLGNLIICAASNGPYSQQIHRLKLAEMDKYLDFVFVSEDIGVSKPDREFFVRSAKRIEESLRYCTDTVKIKEEKYKELSDSKEGNKDDLNFYVKPEECLIIGDSLTSDMTGGRNFGMKTCWYRRDKDRKVDTALVDYYADSVREIADIVRELLAANTSKSRV